MPLSTYRKLAISTAMLAGAAFVNEAPVRADSCSSGAYAWCASMCGSVASCEQGAECGWGGERTVWCHCDDANFYYGCAS